MAQNNETKTCKKCMEEINKKAKRCPKCGANLGIPGFVKFLIIMAVIFFMCISCMASCANSVGDAIDESIKETENSYKDVNGKESFNIGETFENKYIKVKLDSVNTDFKNYSQYSKPDAGFKVVQFVFTAVNIGDDDQYFDYTDFDCYADDTSVKQFYGADDAGLFSGGNISKGKKVTMPVYCEVPVDSEKVIVEYDASWIENTNIVFNAS